MKAGPLQLTPLQDFPAVAAGDSLGALILSAITRQGFMPEPSSMVVIAQKVVSKAEGRLIRLDTVKVTPEARTLAQETGKDDRLVTLILQESKALIRVRPGLIIAEHRTGHILANAGIDSSNVGVMDDEAGSHVLLWPEDPDGSASKLSAYLTEALGFTVPVVINDSLGRPWRMGTVGFAIGVSGFEPVWDQVGERDLDGRIMQVTAPAIADSLAAAASLVQGETDQGQPVVWVEGFQARESDVATAGHLLRPVEQDMFR
ncbi:coenzyme F420-0:L-glutamate ligase [Luminiphilus sp.]|nr:coenzyme F420-0:L-glutamate ligase [Luminiphilus sp.]